MNRYLSRFLQIGIPLGLGVFLIWFIFKSFTPQQLEETKLYFSDANYWYVALSIALSLLSHISRAYRWSFMLEPLGYQTKLANNFMAISVAYLMNIFIPKSGEFSRALILDKYEKVPFQKGFGTIISERIVDLLFLFLFTVLALSLKFDVLYEFVINLLPPYAIYLVLLGLVAVGMGVFLYIKFSNSNINKKVKNFIIGLKDGLFSIIRMRKKTPFIIQSLLIWSLYILSFYCALQSLPETSVIPIGTVIITFVVGSFTFAFTNSGFGTYPVAIAGILAIFGIAKTAGIAFGWIAWVSNISMVVLIGVISLLILPIFNRK